MRTHYLGWDGAVAGKVVSHLLGDRKGPKPVDFGDTIIVVPTLQAGRRLRELLAINCASRGMALLSVTIVTPHHFFSPHNSTAKIAGPALTKLTWAKILCEAGPDECPKLFPVRSRTEQGKFAWALGTGGLLERLRQELADGGHTISSVIAENGDKLEEFDRWEELARLEKRFLSEISGQGFSDVCSAKISCAAAPELDPAIKRIVIAAVPDPSMLAIKALEKLAKRCAVEILLHAPESEKDKFDNWGRPKPECWVQELVEIQEWETNVYLEINPAEQGRKVANLVANDVRFGPSDIGVGVPDVSAIPFLQESLAGVGLPAFDPSDMAFADHPLGQLIGRTLFLLQAPVYSAVADLLRHPDFLRYMEGKHELKSLAVLDQLDRFQNEYLPVDLDWMLDRFKGNEKGNSSKYRDFTELGKALKIVKVHMDALQAGKFEDEWRGFLCAVYEAHQIDSSRIADREFENASGVIEETFREMRGLDGDPRQLLPVFADRLRAQSFSRERTNEVVDLQGWLELQWTDAPFLAVTGMNEQFVPGGSLSDAFMPDSLRKMLGLRDDLSRFGRDVYLMRTLVESRSNDRGRICFIVGKCSMTGDPLKPSRLMFRCRDEDLPARVEYLFRPIENTKEHAPDDIIFKLKPAGVHATKKLLVDRKLSVTAFRDYIECPFRFYLKHVLGMEELSDTKTGLDSLDFGTLVHESLHRMAEDKKLWMEPDPDKLGRYLAELAEAAARRKYGAALPLAALVPVESAKQRLRAFAHRQVQLVGEGWEIIAFEKRMEPVKRKGFSISGTIDRVDRNVNTDAIRIMDYKTSDTGASPESKHLKKGRAGAKRWVDLQLPLYHLLFTKQFGEQDKIELAYFNLPKSSDSTDVSVWKDFNPVVLSSAITCMDGVLDCIAEGIFWPPASKTMYDDPFGRLFLHEPEDSFEWKVAK